MLVDDLNLDSAEIKSIEKYIDDPPINIIQNEHGTEQDLPIMTLITEYEADDNILLKQSDNNKFTDLMHMENIKDDKTYFKKEMTPQETPKNRGVFQNKLLSLGIRKSNSVKYSVEG